MRPHVALALLVGVSWPLAVTASEHHSEMTLEALVGESTLIVVAEPAVPARKDVKVDITPKGKKPDPEKYPAFSRRQERWVVKEVLGGSGTRPGATIVVDEAQWDMRLTVHTKYYVEGLNKIPIYQTYTPGPSFDAGSDPQRILFLRLVGSGIEFAADGAYESLVAKDQVVKLALGGANLKAPALPKAHVLPKP